VSPGTIREEEVLMNLGRRKWVDAGLDRLRFRLDTFPELDYQPLPWLGLSRARRSDGVDSRWREIEQLVDELRPTTALDIGCNVGFFVFSLAAKGLAAVGVERYDRFTRIFREARTRIGLPEVGLTDIELTTKTVSLLPSVDLCLFLSVWHHIAREQGHDVAKDVLTSVWMLTKVVLVFETGESEMSPDYAVHELLGADVEAGIESLLRERCPGGSVRRLGRHPAFGPDGVPCERGLYAVIRDPSK
jgi:SAM-dependent methyltransferase